MSTQTNHTMPLVMLRGGECARITEVKGGQDLNARLASMGIMPGAVVSTVRAGANGPVILNVHESRVAIGRGMAHKIMVEPTG